MSDKCKKWKPYAKNDNHYLWRRKADDGSYVYWITSGDYYPHQSVYGWADDENTIEHMLKNDGFVLKNG